MGLQDKPTKYWANQNRISAFQAAKAGLITLWKEEFNFRIHLLMTLAVVVAGFIFQITTTEWLIIILLIGHIIALEMINSAIETVVDLVVGTKWDQHAKRSKDIAAAAVMMMALIAVVVGLIIFVPYLVKLF